MGHGGGALSTDSCVVRPLFFPGGIGDPAVDGTVNDLAMSGAKAAYLSCAVVIEEGTGLPVARTGLGGTRVVDLPLGEQLPRIC